VLALPHEEAALGQITATSWGEDGSWSAAAGGPPLHIYSCSWWTSFLVSGHSLVHPRGRLVVPRGRLQPCLAWS
jgi:hypothetical protein